VDWPAPPISHAGLNVQRPSYREPNGDTGLHSGGDRFRPGSFREPHFLGACRKMRFENRFVRVARDTTRASEVKGFVFPTRLLDEAGPLWGKEFDIVVV